MPSNDSSTAEPLTVERCSKGVMCTHEEDDPIWQSPCALATTYDSVVDLWIESQWAPEIAALEGREWADGSVVIHQSPVVGFDSRGYKRPVVLTREVKSA